MTDEGLHSKTRALVIGGTQGLGEAIAARLIAEGCRGIVVAGRDQTKGAAAAERLAATFMAVDLADSAATVRLVEAAADRLGGLDALVIAGASTERGSALDTTEALWDRVMTVNLRSPFFALQRFAQMAIDAAHPAAAVNILSMAAHCGQSFLAPYAASKAALANVTRNTAQAWRAHRIRVNGINCGWMDTPGEDAVQRGYHGGGDGWLRKAEAAQPMGSLVKPTDVARLAALMLGPGSGVMTGALVDFDQNVAGAYPE